MSKNDKNGGKSNGALGAGFLEVSDKGFGFLRTSEQHYCPKPTDIFVTPDTIKRNFLREGLEDVIRVIVKPRVGHRALSPRSHQLRER